MLRQFKNVSANICFCITCLNQYFKTLACLCSLVDRWSVTETLAANTEDRFSCDEAKRKAPCQQTNLFRNFSSLALGGGGSHEVAK